MKGLGTIINVAAVVLGSLIGILLRGGIPKRFQDTLMQVLGLSTIFIGISGAMKGLLTLTGGKVDTQNTLIMILSMVSGAVVGEAFDIEQRLDDFGGWLKDKMRSGSSRFVEGFVTASLVICVGAMAVVGSLQDGLTGDSSMLAAKSMLDFVVVIIFASTLGIGVLFSAIPLGIYQGTITAFAGLLEPVLTEGAILNMSFIGSILIFAVGINLCFGKKIKVGNMLPALIFAVLFSFLPFLK
ncbi:MAG: DUF554 domain-containing protein [Eubacteriales bacterium]|jgi:uncharacterized membrane protein YqgA involved in biofilm formation|nr:DUF554 domain-containing protein [Eubacteriales bacterium]